MGGRVSITSNVSPLVCGAKMLCYIKHSVAQRVSFFSSMLPVLLWNMIPKEEKKKKSSRFGASPLFTSTSELNMDKSREKKKYIYSSIIVLTPKGLVALAVLR